MTVSRSHRISDGLITAAADAVAGLSEATAPGHRCCPVEELRTVSAAVAIAVAVAARDEGLAQVAVDDPVQQVHQAMWRPEYPDFEPI